MKRLFAAFLSTLVLLPTSAQKQYKNPVINSDFPDPAVERADDGYFYAYATGPKCKRSKDLITWTDVSSVISRPTWNDSTYIDKDGKKKTDYYSFWACDVSKTVDGEFLMHYACALWGNGNRTGIGVAKGTTPTKFTDVGRMFRSDEIGVHNSIDPVYVEEFDKKYMAWGSFHDIYIAELTDDGLAVKDFKKKTKIGGGAFEGTMIYKRGKYYYMFCSIGSCCEGEKSTYKTVVGRSTSLTGNYVNKQGGRMFDNNYTTIISGDSRWKGPGHNSEIITDDNGDTWLLYHSYDMNNGCNGRLMLLDKITWDKDGWPVIEDGHPSSELHAGPVFYTGNGANVTYKVRNADLSKSNFKGWNVVANDKASAVSGKGYFYAPVATVKGEGATFDISQTVSTSISDGLYEMKVNGLDSEHSVEYYVGKVGTDVYCPADEGKTVPTTENSISNNIINRDYYAQSVYGLVIGGKLTFGMRTKQPLSATEHFHVSNVRLIYRDKTSNADPTALTSVLNSYYAMADNLAKSGKPYYDGYNKTMAAYKEAAEGTTDALTRYNQLLKINRTVDSIQTSIDAYALLVEEVKNMQKKVSDATIGGYVTQDAKDVLAEAEQVQSTCSLKDKDVTALVTRMQTVAYQMAGAFQQGDGTAANPYIIMRPGQLDFMHDVLVKDQMVYFALGADIDAAGIDWKQLNSNENSYSYRISFDGRGHVIRNLTPNGTKYYPSFFGTMCGEIRNTGFVDAKVDGTASGAAIIGGTLGHSSYVDGEGKLLPVIIENCYVTGSVTSKGYVGAIGGTLGNSPVIIRNCYSAASVQGNGTSANYSGGLVGRVRADLTIQNSYAGGAVVSPVAGGVVAGGQASTTPGSIYENVIAWNPIVNGTTAAPEPFGFTTDQDLLSGTYTYAGMTLNEVPNTDGLTHRELLDIAGKWGAPWYKDPSAGNGYPILQWQYDRGDYRDICGFKLEEDPSAILSTPSATAGQTSEIYNLSGQRLSAPAQHGIYIIGGRKVMK